MKSVSRENAFDFLWGITAINLLLGAVFWVWNTVALQVVDFDYSSDELNSILWQGIGSSLWGFGMLALLFTLATTAIVGSSKIDFLREDV
jgi:hypothetical protein